MTLLLTLSVCRAADSPLEARPGPKLRPAAAAEPTELVSRLVFQPSWTAEWQTAVHRAEASDLGWTLERRLTHRVGRAVGSGFQEPELPEPSTFELPWLPTSPPSTTKVAHDALITLLPASLPVRLPKKARVGQSWTHEGSWPLVVLDRGRGEHPIDGTLLERSSFEGWVVDGSRSWARIDRLLTLSVEFRPGAPPFTLTSSQHVLVDPQTGNTVWASARHTVGDGSDASEVAYELAVRPEALEDPSSTTLPVCAESHLGQNGTCVRWEARWDLPADIDQIWPEDDGALLFIYSDGRGTRPELARFDPRTGARSAVALPDQASGVHFGVKLIVERAGEDADLPWAIRDGGRWADLPPPPAGALPLVRPDGTMLSVGGLQEDVASAQFSQLIEGEWKALAPMPEGRFLPELLPFDGGLRVCMGLHKVPEPDVRLDYVDGCVDWTGSKWIAGPQRPDAGRGRLDQSGGAWLMSRDTIWRPTADGFETIPDVVRKTSFDGVRLVSDHRWWRDNHWEPIPGVVHLDYVLPFGDDGWISDHYPRVFVDGAYRWVDPDIFIRGDKSGNALQIYGGDYGMRLQPDGAVEVLPRLESYSGAHAVGVFPDGLMVVAGASPDNDAPKTQTWILARDAAEWAQGEDVPVEVKGPEYSDPTPSAVVGEDLLVFARARSHRWNRSTAVWTPLDKAPFFVDRVWAVEDRVFAVELPKDGRQRTAWWSDAKGWHEAGEAPEARREALWVPLSDGRLLVAGGQLDYAKSPDVWFFSPSEGTWTPGPELPGDRSGGFGFQLSTGEVVWIGGTGGPVWILDSSLASWGAASPEDLGEGLALPTEDGSALVLAKHHLRTLFVEPLPYLDSEP